MNRNLISYSTGKRICTVLLTAVFIAIPLANWLLDPDDFQQRFLGNTKWDLTIFIFAMAWIVYAATWPALRSWQMVGSWKIERGQLVAPDGRAWKLSDFHGARSESHFLRHPTIRVIGVVKDDVEIPTGFRSSGKVDDVVSDLNEAIANERKH